MARRMHTDALPTSPLDVLGDYETEKREGHSVQRFVRASRLPRSPLDPPNDMRLVNNHAEIKIGDKIAYVELDDLEKVKTVRWSKHPRGPITEVIISVKPRKRKYTLMAMTIYGKAVTFIDGNRYDLRRANVADKQLRIGRHTQKGINGGIFFKDGAWKAQAKWRGKALVRSFSVKKYGDGAAQAMARDARKMMVDLGRDAAKARIAEFRKLPRIRRENELLTAITPEPQSLLGLARLYAEREHLPETVIPHLHKMLLLGGGRMPKLELKKDLAPVNIYEGNQEYENCVVEVERDEETGEIQGFQPY